MIPYKNLTGRSNVEAYEITDEAIAVRFKSGRVRNYLYDSVRPGSQIVEKMKVLALQGHGLNSFIVTTVKSRFSRKW